VAERQGIAVRDFLEMRVDFPIVAGVFYFWGIFCNGGRLSEEARQEAHAGSASPGGNLNEAKSGDESPQWSQMDFTQRREDAKGARG
jgi:hypothetical protein